MGAADNLKLTSRDPPPKPIDVLGVIGVEPFHQRAARMQGDPQPFKSLEDVQKRQVTVEIRLLEHAVEIADRLVVVQDQDEA